MGLHQTKKFFHSTGNHFLYNCQVYAIHGHSVYWHNSSIYVKFRNSERLISTASEQELRLNSPWDSKASGPLYHIVSKVQLPWVYVTLKTDQITLQMSSQKEGKMRQERKNNGQENNANIIPIVKEELTAFPKRLSGNQP